MTEQLLLAAGICLFCLETAAPRQPGLVGHWDCNAGAGAVLRDSSGHGNHGTLHGPKWVASGTGYALQFDGVDDWIDCGHGKSLDIRGPMTLSAWIRPFTASALEPGIVGKYFDSYALTLYRGGCWWYISSGDNHAAAPLAKTGIWHHVVGTFDGATMRLYINGFEVAKNKSKSDRVNAGKNFLMGCIAPHPEAPGAVRRARGYFAGLLDEVKVYNRALSLREVIAEYNRQAMAKGRAKRDTSWFDRFRLKIYNYPGRRRLVVRVNYLGLLPIAKEDRICVNLKQSGIDEPVAAKAIAPDPNQPEAEVTFPLDPRAPGKYEVQAVLNRRGGAVVVEKVALSTARPTAKLPDPAEKTAAPLPRPLPPVQYAFSLAAGGGFSVDIDGTRFAVTSSYSFPHGGSNRLLASDHGDDQGESKWRVRVRRVDSHHYHVQAAGEFYRLGRRITLRPNHVLVQDTLTNTTDDVVGIILGNHVAPRAAGTSSIMLPGNATFFVSDEDHGIGVIGLDDVYQLQQETHAANGIASMVTKHFGLGPHASYTVQWAVYPTATNDYYEFVNAFRKVEGLNRTVEGAFGLIGDGEGLTTAADRRVPPSPKVVRAKGMKYVSYFYLIAPADDPGMSLEGIEFAEYPKESALLKKVIANAHRLNPGLKVAFHIAHGLYATNRPEQLFPDARVIDAAGRQIMYGGNSADYYCRYFSRERFDEGYRWWIFYPTMDNSFGKALLNAIDYMLDEIGASAMYADGFISGYARGYTYDTWDGHSVEIDPDTKCVTRKMGNVTLLALPVLKAVIRKVAARGGVVITNGQPGPRSLWKENYFTTCETSGGDQLPISRLHAGPTVTAFGDPTRIKNRRDLYLDVLAKLDWGALYFYYGDRNLSVDEEMLVRYMYPLTLDELHAGWIKGKERIITKVPGVYGWTDDRHIHKVYRSDSRGILVPNTDFSTADAGAIRTELRLADLESAVIEKLPVQLTCAQPVNFLVERYDATGLVLRVNAHGRIRLILEPGQFPITKGRRYVVSADGSASTTQTADRRLVISRDVIGRTTIRVTTHP